MPSEANTCRSSTEASRSWATTSLPENNLPPPPPRGRTYSEDIAKGKRNGFRHFFLYCTFQELRNSSSFSKRIQSWDRLGFQEGPALKPPPGCGRGLSTETTWAGRAPTASRATSPLTLRRDLASFSLTRARCPENRKHAGVASGSLPLARICQESSERGPEMQLDGPRGEGGGLEGQSAAEAGLPGADAGGLCGTRACTGRLRHQTP